MDKANGIAMASLGMGDGSITTELLAIVTHDLRSPLTTISVGTSLLDEGAPSEKERAEILQIIMRATYRMERLLADLLEVSGMEGGRTLPIQPCRMDLVTLLTEVRDAFVPQARAKGRRLECRLPEKLPFVYADRNRVHQVLGNLIGNALKFTPEGGRITVTADHSDRHACCSVTDTGPGMTEEERSRLFDVFWQAPGKANLGIGLGLKIAKAIVDGHGGVMRVESRPGAGSTFSFTLPLVNGSCAGDQPASLSVSPEA
jgi:signal transduction histidine kinase